MDEAAIELLVACPCPFHSSGPLLPPRLDQDRSG
jgi:hypothetical protein